MKVRVVALAALLLLFSQGTFSQGTLGQSTRPASADSAREFNMLVLGDSILWGQGLKEQNKTWYLVKNWLQTRGFTVQARVEAHSGAMIGSAGAEMPKLLTTHGELNSAYPTLHDQIDDAVRAYIDPSRVDLVLLDGCINDVNARKLLNAANTSEGIQTFAQEKCGPPVELLLTRIASTFPNAHIIMSGYYPVFSDKSPRDFFMRALAKRFYVPPPNAEKMSSKEMLTRLAANSVAWYEASNRSLSNAVAKVDANLLARGSRQRVLFAKIPFEADHAFAARRSHLWGFDASFLKKLLVVLTLGRFKISTNDEVRGLRSSVCRDFYKPAPGETDDRKKARETELIVCRLSAIAHPNRKGAVLYADAIKQQMQNLISNPGWLRAAATGASSK